MKTGTNSAKLPDEEVALDERRANHSARQMENGRWLAPLRHASSCAEASYALQHGWEDGSPQLNEANRPACDSTPFSATHLDHPPVIPMLASTNRLGARCQAQYGYDSAGFIHEVDATCTLTEEGEPLSDPDVPSIILIREAYEESVERTLMRMRVERSADPHVGLRQGTRPVIFQWQGQ